MDRLINVKVSGNFLTKDGNRAGVQGEGNVTTLRLTFDAGWDGLAKHLTWWDAYGEHPVKVILGADLLEDLAEDTRTYRCLIPPEPLAVDGWCSFVIDGYIDDKRQRTVEDKLKVLPAGSAEDAPAPSDPTPSQAEQLQREIDALLGGMQEAARESKEAQIAIENMSVTAEHVPHDSGLPALERDVNDDGSVALHFNILRPLNNVYVGDGPMPEGYNVQLDPNGEGYDLYDLTAEVLQEAKESGLFDGEKGETGQRGTGVIMVSLVPTYHDVTADGIRSYYRQSLAKIKEYSQFDDVLVGDLIFSGAAMYKVLRMDETYAYLSALSSIRGEKGADGKDGADGTVSFDELTDAQRESLRGPEGKQGPVGPAGADGTVAFDELTEAQRESLRGEQGEKGDTGDKGDRGDPGVYVGSGAMPANAYIQIDPNGEGVDLEAMIAEAVAAAMQNATTARIGEVNLLASAWTGSGNLWSQVVQLDGVTERSQVDLTPSVEQLAIWYDKSLAFVAEQENGIVTVFAIGQKPANDYTVQVTITEVNV